jgi:nucleoside-diphosphate-sugar epimerase
MPSHYLDYAHLTHDFLGRYDEIILMAGHSSVPMAIKDPSGAFYNNIVAFHRLLEMLDDDQRLIYASSSSVYSGFGAEAASESLPSQTNAYDFSKLADDVLAHLSGKQCYGLRFGTVNGPSPNLRTDIMLNKMVDVAQRTGEVRIQNPTVRRPILGINDLTRAIRTILHGDGASGIYNLASFNSTVAALGATVADVMDIPLITGAPAPSYDFEIDTTKFQTTYDFTFHETAASIVQDLIGGQHGGNT